MSDLPTRESYKRAGVTLDDVTPVLREYVRGDLLTREEAANDPDVRRMVMKVWYQGWSGVTGDE